MNWDNQDMEFENGQQVWLEDSSDPYTFLSLDFKTTAGARQVGIAIIMHNSSGKIRRKYKVELFTKEQKGKLDTLNEKETIRRDVRLDLISGKDALSPNQIDRVCELFYNKGYRKGG